MKKIATLSLIAFPKMLFASGGTSELPEAFITLGFVLLILFLGVRYGKQPAILVSIAIGIAIISLLPHEVSSKISHNPFLFAIGEIGLVMLMFVSGLEGNFQTITKNLKNGGSNAIIGILLVGSAGYLVAKLLLPEASGLTHFVIAAALTPTSAGIPASIFSGKNSFKNEQTTTIVGAITDDIIGLIILTVVNGLLAGKTDPGSIAISTFTAIAFIVIGTSIGQLGKKQLQNLFDAAKAESLTLALVFCFIVAGLAFFAGLAPMIGGYVAGLILIDIQIKDSHGEPAELEHTLAAKTVWMLPAFFVLLGMKLNVANLTGNTILFGLALTIATLIGKGLTGKLTEKISGGTINGTFMTFSMTSRGEVAAIMALSAANAGLFASNIVEGFVLMIIMTSVICVIGTNKLLKNWKIHSKFILEFFLTKKVHHPRVLRFFPWAFSQSQYQIFHEEKVFSHQKEKFFSSSKVALQFSFSPIS